MNVALRSDNLNVISLCTGGGGLDLGIELAIPSTRSVVFVEREAFAAAHLVSAMQQGLMAQAALWSDVTTFDGRPWRGIVDGVIGGIPCQPHSLAGKRAGSDDDRDLWSDARRIIVRSRPWFVLIENVSGMLSAKPGLDPGALRVRRDLQRLGFNVEGGLFTAAEVGASHERERVFILAVADASGAAGWGDAGAISGPQAPRGHEWQYDGDMPDGFGVGGRAMGHTSRERRREGRPEPEFWGGRDSLGGANDAMGNAFGGRHDGRPDGAVGRSIERTLTQGASSEPHGSLADADIIELRRQSPAGQQLQLQRDNPPSLFPPGPGDLSRWRYTLERAPELEPAFRRVADGLASRLDTARVDRLRLLGNGVVSLEAAYAVRTLATRLAASGTVGAKRLVRMMVSA